ncbi:hypothetical protein HMPREF9135_2406 [Segatella baroniae F0067]|uniref:Uncharacterized protein n=1 Tax=Segatella baroniae F0067 TaxID=1115809 RepID=U2NM60_9BACT|nr:hypothetical protein HMPREF9135_2406 [Segatella baroniae F0067]
MFAVKAGLRFPKKAGRATRQAACAVWIAFRAKAITRLSGGGRAFAAEIQTRGK